MVPDLPVALSLQETATVWLEPATAPGSPAALARAVVAQFVLWHSPADARLAVVAAPAALAAVGVGQVAAARRPPAAAATARARCG